jgi:hypothetical protein
MKRSEYEQVCYNTEQRDEQVVLRNVKTGKRGFSLGCTKEGETVQVRLTDGELDSWPLDECVEEHSR